MSLNVIDRCGQSGRKSMLAWVLGCFRGADCRAHVAASPLHAHQIATRAEQAAVCAAGVNWRDYDRFMQKYVKQIGDERLTKVPHDLDTKPYRDEHDDDLLQRMLECIDKGQVPKGFRGDQLRVAARDIHQYIRRHQTLGARRAAAIERKAT
jgi:hypothetical protein